MENTIYNLKETDRAITLEVKGAQLMYTNFAGKVGEYNRDGRRTFNLVLTDEGIVRALEAINANVKTITPKVNEGDTIYHIPVSLDFHDEFSGLAHLNPKAYLITDYEAQEYRVLDETTIGILDGVDAQRIDLILSFGKERVLASGRNNRKAWLKEIYVRAQPSLVGNDYLFITG